MYQSQSTYAFWDETAQPVDTKKDKKKAVEQLKKAVARVDSQYGIITSLEEK